jgi:hypothetical protein
MRSNVKMVIFVLDIPELTFFLYHNAKNDLKMNQHIT